MSYMIQSRESKKNIPQAIIARIFRSSTFQIYLCVVPLGTFAFLWPAILNGYPLVYFDTANYLRAAFTRDFEHYIRGIGYPVWLCLTGVRFSGWLPVIFQAIMNAALLCAVAQLVLGDDRRRLWMILFAVLGTALLSAGPRYASCLMADALTPWMFLGLCLWLIGTGRKIRIVGILLTSASALGHNSHLPILLSCALLLGALFLIVPGKVRTSTRRSILGVICVAVLLFPLNWFLGKTVKSGGSIWSLFLFNSFIGTGVVVETLDHYCPDTGWASCELRQEFVEISNRRDPDWFLWKQDSPIRDLGWFRNQDEPKAILLHAFRCCPMRIIIGTLSGAWKQFWKIDSNEDIYPKTTQPVRTIIATGLPGELARFDASKQASPSLSHENSVKTVLIPGNEQVFYIVVYCLSLIMMLVTWFRKHRRITTMFFLLQTMLISNALVCSFAGTLHARLQGRIAWLIVFCVLLGILTVVRGKPAERVDRYPSNALSSTNRTHHTKINQFL